MTNRKEKRRRNRRIGEEERMTNRTEKRLKQRKWQLNRNPSPCI